MPAPPNDRRNEAWDPEHNDDESFRLPNTRNLSGESSIPPPPPSHDPSPHVYRERPPPPGFWESVRSFRTPRPFKSMRSVVTPSKYSMDRKSHRRFGRRGGSDGTEVAKSSRRVRFTPPDPESLFPRNTPPEPNPPLKIPTVEPTSSSKHWARFSAACTFFVPDGCIRREGAAAKQAWREKVATCVLVLLASSFFVGFFGFVPLFVCQDQELYTWDEIAEQNEGIAFSLHTRSWSTVHGGIYDLESLGAIPQHTTMSGAFPALVGKDLSDMFPRPPPSELPEQCFNATALAEREPTEATCPQPADGTEDEFFCHENIAGTRFLSKFMGEYRKGTLAWTVDDRNERGGDWVVIRNRVYNVTSYTDILRDEDTGRIDEDSPNAYFAPDLHLLVTNRLGEDATEYFDTIATDGATAEAYLECMDEMFYVGDNDYREDPFCDSLNFIMYFLLIFVVAILLLQCLCSLLYVARKKATLSKDMLERQVMVMVPCYNEGEKELGKTIKSVMETDFPEDNKVLLVVADGIITGKDEAMSTPATLADILGFEFKPEIDKAHQYRSIGAKERNRAFVYSGTQEKDGKKLKYVVVVKCGVTSERSSPRAGNRGKRDSQLIVAGMLNRMHYGREMCELDLALYRALSGLGISVEDLTYMMAIDADTRVHKDSMSQMLFAMEKDETILACCGETKVDNKSQSWVTACQVYEYYSSHHMKKAFESVFGCVTCLPGCFSLYRIKTDDDNPLISCDYVYGRYARNDVESLHEKNLYHLGEDRMLTTLLLQHFYDMKLSFVPEAVCWTIVPHTFKILLSQRRRWINSTLHNMMELLKVKTMCGIGFASMKTVVVTDVISTAILPASLAYFLTFVVVVLVRGQAIDNTILLVYGVTLGCQVVVFMFRARWDYFLWFFVYTILGIPVFFFLLPLYSFWHMDDLSWGQTRQVQADTTGGVEGKVEDMQKSSRPKGETTLGEDQTQADDLEVVDLGRFDMDSIGRIS